MAKREVRINQKIRSPEVYVIGSDGKPQGVLSTYEAIKLAESYNLDLIEISPNARPPVCKILDYDKYRYELEKKLKEQKRNQQLAVVKIREVRMQPKIDTNDMNTKSKAIASFLNGGDKCKVTIRFKGRELAHTELGRDVLFKILDSITEMGVQFSMEARPRMEGRTMTMLLSPKNKKK
ncbi:MAG: translation initiation factor IF-3 [Sphaerochaetaceae bacterium]